MQGKGSKMQMPSMLEGGRRMQKAWQAVRMSQAFQAM